MVHYAVTVSCTAPELIQLTLVYTGRSLCDVSSYASGKKESLPCGNPSGTIRRTKPSSSRSQESWECFSRISASTNGWPDRIGSNMKNSSGIFKQSKGTNVPHEIHWEFLPFILFFVCFAPVICETAKKHRK